VRFKALLEDNISPEEIKRRFEFRLIAMRKNREMFRWPYQRSISSLFMFFSLFLFFGCMY